MTELETPILPEQKWRETIRAADDGFTIGFRELLEYRDLLLILVKRDISSIYKQTVLGPTWFFLQPIFTTLVYFVIFSRIAKFELDMPPALFYLGGIIMWNYFADCLLKISSALKDNSQIFSKVYFPRLIIPLSIGITNLVKLSIQLVLFALVFLYYFLTTNQLHPGPWILFFPLLILVMALLALGCGLIVASLTIRYKDLSHLLTFSVQLVMFVSAVFFPLDKMDEGVYKKIIQFNPMSGLIETFRYLFSGKGSFHINLLGYDVLCALLVLFAGLFIFKKTEKDFVDTI